MTVQTRRQAQTRINKESMAMSFNLSEWALKNRTLVLYAMILLGAMGAISYDVPT